ncbi:MAG: acetylornithine/succinylornithine family transaminase [Ignavibacteria bacterium]|nr:acetylornithine/succinylornithine family transaminase [Ignavibacteria bacterium]
MKDLNELVNTEDQDFFHTYKRLKVVIERGDGCYLFTDKGEKILDMFGGLAVNVLGYNHPKINAAIEDQVKRYVHISNLFYQEKQIALADKILQLTGFSKVFFSNSGTESVEAAIKLIRKYFLGTNKKTLISFTGSFHGRTIGALSLTARRKYRDQFEPLMPGVKHLEFNSLSDLEDNINDDTAGVFVECIQGEGGVNMATDAFITKINELKEKYGFIVVADEIQSGVGRTGKMHGFEHFGLDADIVTLAKGIGGGLPLGAILGNERVKNVFSVGEHGSTFGGNPVAAACGLVIFTELENGLMDKVNRLSEYLFAKLNIMKSKFPEKIKDIRGKGLMIGIELNSPGQPVVEKMMQKEVLVNCTNENVIRLLPPYIIAENDIDLFIDRFSDSV